MDGFKIQDTRGSQSAMPDSCLQNFNWTDFSEGREYEGDILGVFDY